MAIAERSPYERQLREACRLVTPLAGSHAASPLPPGEGQGEGVRGWDLVFQSRSGPPAQAWLEPDIRDRIRQLHAADRVADVVIVPMGFLTENLEVVYDLDVEVRALCEELGINMVRAAVVGSHPRFVGMIRELVLERIDAEVPCLALGPEGPWPDQCPGDCCRPA